ncbi:hypothetical protein ACN42_g3559 [Penicillium freii]|uniref:Uncharacterized protein n=1 Tax=Penicillium freii TaxID=48697 RepID=A0A124GS76_PENFR|nr:hypothetical protein ACN42_g3559 [Penicillium freii]
MVTLSWPVDWYGCGLWLSFSSHSIISIQPSEESYGRRVMKASSAWPMNLLTISQNAMNLSTSQKNLLITRIPWLSPSLINSTSQSPPSAPLRASLTASLSDWDLRS